MSPSDLPHRRYNPLSGDWVLVSPHRGSRPWLGAEETVAPATRPVHEATCALCPGNSRAGGATNPDYRGPYVFQNDFPALLAGPVPETAPQPADPLFRRQAVTGEARVVCFSERHDLSLAGMSVEGIGAVVQLWQDQMRDLSRAYENVLIFENKGAAMGCSNPHPHGQIWATDYQPTEIAKEEARQKGYFDTHGRPLLTDYVAKEIAAGARIVFRTAHWVSVVPYWAVWPFETILVPIAPIPTLVDLPAEVAADLACALQRQTRLYDRLFETEFPYSMGWHGAPGHRRDAPHWVLHAHFYPPLLRSATIRKYMVGFELLGEPQRDLTPEKAAAVLRAIAEAPQTQTGETP